MCVFRLCTCILKTSVSHILFVLAVLNLHFPCVIVCHTYDCIETGIVGRPLMPSVKRLQQLIEYAWSAGFDEAGCRQLGGKLVDTRRWIGATEIYALLSFLGVR